MSRQRLDVRNKTRDELVKLLRTRRRKDLIDIIRKLATLEQHFTAEEIARARKLPKRQILAWMRDGTIAPAHKRSGHRWDASLEAIRGWDAATAIVLAQQHANGNGSNH